MKKILTLILLFVAGFSFVSCGKKEDNKGGDTTQALTAPVVTVNGTTISWAQVANASSYDIKEGATTLKTVTVLTYDLSTLSLTEGDHSIVVVAKAAGYTEAQSSPVTVTIAAAGNLDKVPTETEFKNLVAGKTIYVSTCGQADLDTITNLMTKSGLKAGTDYTSDNLLTADKCDKGSVVFLVVGASNKGLTSAGANKAGEEARATAFASAASAGDITLIVLHVGGTQRRGTTSNTMIDNACMGADLMLVVNTGNADGYFTQTSEDLTIPLYEYTSVAKMLATFKYILGK